MKALSMTVKGPAINLWEKTSPRIWEVIAIDELYLPETVSGLGQLAQWLLWRWVGRRHDGSDCLCTLWVNTVEVPAYHSLFQVSQFQNPGVKH